MPLRSCSRRVDTRLHVESFDELGEDVVQVIDLLVGVGGGDLYPEADLLPWHERVCGEGHVDAAVEEELAHQIDIAAVGEGKLDDRQLRSIGRVDGECLDV